MVLVRSLNWDHSVVTVDEEEQTEDGVEGGGCYQPLLVNSGINSFSSFGVELYFILCSFVCQVWDELNTTGLQIVVPFDGSFRDWDFICW